MTYSTTIERSTAKPAKRVYSDLHEHIEALRKAGLLIEVDRLINKDTEMHPLVRWQFRGGIAPEDRKAFLFTNLTDSKGRKYDIPVIVCGLAGNNQILLDGDGVQGRGRQRHLDQGVRQSNKVARSGKCALPGNRLHRKGPAERARVGRPSGADLLARMGQRSLYDLKSFRHRRS